MLISAVIFLCSLTLLANSLCILNHMTAQTSHLARIFYTSTSTWGLLCLLAPPSAYWAWAWVYAGFVVLHLAYQPRFVKDRNVPWFFNDGHRRHQ